MCSDGWKAGNALSAGLSPCTVSTRRIPNSGNNHACPDPLAAPHSNGPPENQGWGLMWGHGNGGQVPLMPREGGCWAEERSRPEDTTIQCPQAPGERWAALRRYTVALESPAAAEVKP